MRSLAPGSRGVGKGEIGEQDRGLLMAERSDNLAPLRDTQTAQEIDAPGRRTDGRKSGHQKDLFDNTCGLDLVDGAPGSGPDRFFLLSKDNVRRCSAVYGFSVTAIYSSTVTVQVG